MESNKQYDFNDEESEACDIDLDEPNLPDIDRVNYLASLDISVPYSTNTRFSFFGGDNPSTSKISMISENQTTENFIKEFDCFYTEMMGKVNGLKNSPVLKNSLFPEDLDMDEEKLFKNLKHTPEVQEQLDNIRKLDDEISSMICEYNYEKEERLQTQYEMCKEITENNTLPERDTELFLNLCRFDFSDAGDNDMGNKQVFNEKKKKNAENNAPDNFIMRNIYLAKEGIFANSSLTDEEKFKLEQLLQNDSECNSPKKMKNPFTIPSFEHRFRNEFKFTIDESQKIGNIDSELEKFKLDEENKEKDVKKDNERSNINIKQEIDKLNDFMLEQRLKRLENKFKMLREAEEKAQEKLKTTKIPGSKDTSENSDDELNNIEVTALGDMLNIIEEEDTQENDAQQNSNEDRIDEDTDIQKIYDKIMKEGYNVDEELNEITAIRDQYKSDFLNENQSTTEISIIDDDANDTIKYFG